MKTSKAVRNSLILFFIGYAFITSPLFLNNVVSLFFIFLLSFAAAIVGIIALAISVKKRPPEQIKPVKILIFITFILLIVLALVSLECGIKLLCIAFTPGLMGNGF